ncbi:MAG: carboxypeptidase regulatory-like domain-containing protein, partial [Actinomycetota bacterium]
PALQVGVVRGTVRGLSAEAVPFARVTAISETDSVPRTVTADAAGFYSHNLRADSYSFRASAFHYDSQTIPGVSVTAGNQPACFPASLCPRDFSLFRQPGYTVSGVVTDTATGGKIYGVIVSLNHPNIPDVFADSQGNYVFSDIPAGAYRLGVGGTNRCVLVTSKTITVTTNTVENIGTSLKRDSFGYSCRDESPISTAHESGVLTTTALNGDDVWVDMALPFLFPLYGNLATRAFISSNGFMRFDAGSAQFSNVIIPNTTAPNFVVMPFWDDLTMDGGSRVQTHTDTDGFFSVEWIDMVPNSDPDTRVTFEVILHPSGNFEYQYRVVDPDKANGYTASIGFEDRTGVRGFSYSFDEASVASGRRVRFLIDGSEVLGGSGPGGGGGGPGGGGGGSFVPSGVAGLVLRSGTSSPLPGATISRCGGCVTGTVTSLADGTYSLPLPAGTYSITASKFGSIPQTKSVTVGSTFVRLDFDLAPAPLYKLSGVIKDQFGVPVPGIEISVRELAALKASSIYADNAGKYSVILPQADYEVKLPGRCVVSTVPASPIAVALTGPVVRDITANLLADTYGYTCVDKLGSYVAGTVPIFLPGPGTKLFAGAAPLGPVYSPRIDGVGDDTSIPVPLPFDIPLYGKARKVAFVNVDGFVRFDNGVGGLDGPTLNVLNNPAFIVDGAEIYVGLVGIDRFVIEWRGVRLGDSANRVNVEVILNNNGFIDYVYRPGSDQATSAAKIGMEDGCAGGAVLTYAASVLNSVRSGQGILLRPPTAALPGYVAC